jgi:hypothetical protein
VQPSRKSRISVPDLGQLCLMHLTEDPEELRRFMVAAGYEPQGLREAVGTEHLALGLIDYFAQNEPLMLAVCTANKLRPEDFMQVWQTRNRSA